MTDSEGKAAGVMSAVALAALLAYHFSDVIHARVTTHYLSCKTMQGSECQSGWRRSGEIEHRASVDQQFVIRSTDGTPESDHLPPLVRLSGCVVLDRLNWTCDAGPEQRVSMRDGAKSYSPAGSPNIRQFGIFRYEANELLEKYGMN